MEPNISNSYAKGIACIVYSTMYILFTVVLTVLEVNVDDNCIFNLKKTWIGVWIVSEDIVYENNFFFFFFLIFGLNSNCMESHQSLIIQSLLSSTS